MTARDLDLVIGGAAVALAGVLSLIAEPASAITILLLLFLGAGALLGEERLAALWQAYCREPAPRRVRVHAPERHAPRRPPVGPDRRPLLRPKLPRARVVASR